MQLEPKPWMASVIASVFVIGGIVGGIFLKQAMEKEATRAGLTVILLLWVMWIITSTVGGLWRLALGHWQREAASLKRDARLRDKVESLIVQCFYICFTAEVESPLPDIRWFPVWRTMFLQQNDGIRGICGRIANGELPIIPKLTPDHPPRLAKATVASLQQAVRTAGLWAE